MKHSKDEKIINRYNRLTKSSALFKPIYEFHIAREKREYYQFEERLFAQTGNVIFSDFYMVRVFAEKMNRKRDLGIYPERAIKAGQLNAMGLIDEILHYVIELYMEQQKQGVFTEALKWLDLKLDQAALNQTLLRFITLFPPLAVYRGELSPEKYLAGKTVGVSNREITLIEMVVYHLANSNPAFSNFRELFDDTELSHETIYRDVIAHVDVFFETQPTFGPDHQSLIEMLRTPARRYPNSLFEQLEFIRERWGYMLSKYIMRLLSSIDLIKEEQKLAFMGPGPAEAADFRALGLDDEPERFSTDLHWMPKVVMIAKSTYVWLDQLSKKYQRNIYRLDHIPDEELDILANRGFTALWLIGLWERSPASQKIKQIAGNPEAVSSAYSLYDYTIAHDLGGDEALNNLRSRAWRRGIRVASDMVPNHTGIYSKWVVEHPDWFIQTSYPVFPSYSFNGPNLSSDDRVGVYIEDGYWSRSDAAVQFKRVDHHTSDTRYIFHGNDGTSMPWNDTAQLNYLNPEVREAVIQLILHVARQFPVIRLDAAMTLAKKHFQRLWFPMPGSGGDIPGRSGFAMGHDNFNRLFPVEFWREVVDRVAQEAPDTLLLAEAFWMMEGYFVRSLGMHRVYNSAFMNMLKTEDNQKYRQAIKNVMDFNPEIMKRYVNFMNNPDEETAVAQFGKDDKYFGVCTLMATLPGLPMFGHGQIEGFAEKYGMEYRRAYWDEPEDVHLVARHEREIFPLLKKRYLFSEVRNFILYDFYSTEGHVNENVFAFSNRTGDERALVLYNNKYDRATGWIRLSCAAAEKVNDQFVQFSLHSGLALSFGSDTFVVFRDVVSGLEFIRNNDDIAHNGLFAQLDGFKYHVFLDFREIRDNEYGHYRQLCNLLNGRGVPSIAEALRETFLSPVHEPFRNLIYETTPDMLSGRSQKNLTEFVSRFTDRYTSFLQQIQQYGNAPGDVALIVKEKSPLMKRLLTDQKFDFKGIRAFTNVRKIIREYPLDQHIQFSWIILHRIGALQDENYADFISLSWMDELLLTKILDENFRSRGFGERELQLLNVLVANGFWLSQATENKNAAFGALVQNYEAQQFLQVNRYQGILYFNKENFERLIGASLTLITLTSDLEPTTLKEYFQVTESLMKAADKAGYRVSQTQEILAEG